MSDRSVAYNNAAIRLMEAGNQAVALDLFRSALESKTANEQAQSIRTSMAQPDNENIDTSPVPVAIVERAERHLVQLDSYLDRGASGVTVILDPSLLPASHDHDGIVLPANCRGYDPFIYKKPFKLSDSNDASVSVELQHVVSSKIVFNLGLIHQLAWATSSKAADFYEIAASLLAPLPDVEETFMLRVALLNNFGVWCYESGNPGMRSCFEELEPMLSGLVDNDLRESLEENIRQLLAPEGSSQAA